jgi:hypothetical protein
VQAVTPHYFEAMQIPLMNGRAIGDEDGMDALPTVVISQSVAQHYWPDSDPMGRHVRLWSSQKNWFTVVGVSGDLKEWFSGDLLPGVYISSAQNPRLNMKVFLRTAGDPMRLASAVRAQVFAVDRNQPAYNLSSMEQTISDQTSGVKLSARSMTTYAIIALALALSGIYAVSSYLVVQRTYEIGIRTALGASQWNVLSIFFWQSAKMAATGLGIGILTAIVLVRVVSSILYNIVSLDVVTLALLALLLGACALLAAYIPARRATNIDPVIALKNQ